jgi:hypothetical protein
MYAHKTKNDIHSAKKFLLLAVAVVVLVGGFFLAGEVPTDSIKDLGRSLPLPLFTFVIALIDGFNPCNLFVLTLLISLVLTKTVSLAKVVAIGASFIGVVYLFYFLFMATWLNVFKYIGFIEPLRILIAVIAIGAGLINCKELFFFKKGISLTIAERHVGPLRAKARRTAELVKKGSMPALIGSAVVLAVFSSLVELPCTAGFPIIYTGILTGRYLDSSAAYYGYLMLYNLVYVAPLLLIMATVVYSCRKKVIKKSTVAVIKFGGGTVMLLLGLILLVNPAVLGL